MLRQNDPKPAIASKSAWTKEPAEDLIEPQGPRKSAASANQCTALPLGVNKTNQSAQKQSENDQSPSI